MIYCDIRKPKRTSMLKEEILLIKYACAYNNRNFTAPFRVDAGISVNDSRRVDGHKTCSVTGRGTY